jgi:hypothetical protein
MDLTIRQPTGTLFPVSTSVGALKHPPAIRPDVDPVTILRMQGDRIDSGAVQPMGIPFPVPPAVGRAVHAVFFCSQPESLRVVRVLHNDTHSPAVNAQSTAATQEIDNRDPLICSFDFKVRRLRIFNCGSELRILSAAEFSRMLLKIS